MKNGDTVYFKYGEGFLKVKIVHIFDEDKVQISEMGNDFKTVNKKHLVPDYIYESPLFRAMKEYLPKQEINI